MTVLIELSGETIDKLNAILDTDVSSEGDTTLTLVSWPFSRALVTAFLIGEGLEFERTQINKRLEEFKIESCSDAIEDVAKKLIKEVNSIARKANGKSFYKTRNNVTDAILDEYFGQDMVSILGKGKSRPFSMEKENGAKSEKPAKSKAKSTPKVEEPKETIETEDDGLEDKTVPQLREIAKTYSIKGAWKMKHVDLVSNIRSARKAESL